jgi:hypothetical protein
MACGRVAFNAPNLAENGVVIDAPIPRVREMSHRATMPGSRLRGLFLDGLVDDLARDARLLSLLFARVIGTHVRTLPV